MNILLCAKFFPGHFKAGKNTDFARKILNGTKKHTVRSNYEYWKLSLERAKEIPGRILSAAGIQIFARPNSADETSSKIAAALRQKANARIIAEEKSKA